jgi:hypothetical protein
MVAAGDPCLCGTNARLHGPVPAESVAANPQSAPTFNPRVEIFLTVQEARRLVVPGAQKEFCDVRGSHGSYGSGERRGFPGPCI